MTLKFELANNPNKKPLTMYNSIVFQNHAYDAPACIVMLDTGATLPVWCALPTTLKKLFPDAYLAPYKGFIRGFGGKGKCASAVILPQFKLKDGLGNYITFIDLPVIIYPMDNYYDMILSFSMLQHFNFAYKYFDDSGKYPTPKLEIESQKSIYWFGKRYAEDINNNKVLRDIYILTQDEV